MPTKAEDLGEELKEQSVEMADDCQHLAASAKLLARHANRRRVSRDETLQIGASAQYRRGGG